jgi:hypothetical protein
MIGSPISAPSETAIALATTPSETKPSTRAWLPSATRAGLERRFPARSRTCAAISLPRKPTIPAAASTHRCESCCGWINARRDEDGEDDGEPGPLLAPEGAHVEHNPERQRRQRVTEVVDQVSQQRDRARQDEERDLHSGNKPEYGEAERDGLDARARAHDRAIDEPVRVAVVGLLRVLMLMLVWLYRL